MTIGIIGFSRFGQLLAKILKPYGQILVYNRSDKSQDAKNLGVEYVSLEKVCECDWIILAVAISATEMMIKKIAPLVKKGSLVMDVCSVKVLPAKWLQAYLPQEVELLATHPMFGPDSAKEGTSGLQWVICPLRIGSGRLGEVKEVMRGLDVNVIETTPEDHDQQTAISLALVHFIGRGLAEFGFKDQPIKTLGFERLLKVNETVTNDSWQLFLDMQNFNPYTEKIRQKFIKSLKNVDKKIKSNGN